MTTTPVRSTRYWSSAMSTDVSHPIPNLALLATELSDSTAKRLVASVRDAESMDELHATLTAALEARLAVERKGLERADAEVA